MTHKKIEVCQMCKTKQTLKSSWGLKSPPQDQLKKKRFRNRWHTLSIRQQCEKCFTRSRVSSSTSGNDSGGGGGSSGGCGGVFGEEERNCLILSYFKDETEQSLKGQFEVGKGSLSTVDHITEDCPSKYRKCPFILRWELSNYGDRILYMIVENENERDLWIKAFENYFKIQDQNANVKDEFDSTPVEKFEPETNSKLQRAIAASRKSRSSSKTYSMEPSDNVNTSTDQTDHPGDKSPRKRSGGSFCQNDNTNDFEEEIPDGYNYLPPKESSPSHRRFTGPDDNNDGTSVGYNYLPPKESSPYHRRCTDPDDEVDSTPEGYNYLPPKKSSSGFYRSTSRTSGEDQQKLKNCSYQTRSPSLKMDNSPSETNYCNVQLAKPPTPTKSIKQVWRQQSRDTDSTKQNNDQTDGQNMENYSILPSPKTAPPHPFSAKTERKQSYQSEMNYSYVPPPKPATPVNSITNPWKQKETADLHHQNSFEINKNNDQPDSQNMENYSYLPSPKTAKPHPVNAKTENLNSYQSDTNYSYVPPPKPATPVHSMRNPWKQKEIADLRLQNNHQTDENQNMNFDNYTYLPPANSSTRKSLKIKSAHQTDMSYSIVPTPKPLSLGMPTAMNPWKQKELEDNPVNLENYHVLPPAKPATPTSPGSTGNSQSIADQKQLQFGASNMSIRRLSHEKYKGQSVSNTMQQGTGGAPSADENYINFAPIKQMKMIAKHNVRPPNIKTEAGKEPNASYINFKF